MKKNVSMLVVLGCLLLLGPSIFAGVVFEIETKDHEQSPKAEVTQAYMEGKNIKMAIPSGAGGGETKDEMIFRGDRREMIVTDSQNKTYFVVDEESVRQIKAQMGGVEDQMAIARKELKKHLSNMNEDQKRALEQALGQPEGGAGEIFGAGPQSTEVRNTGKRGEKKGYPCVLWVILRGGQKTHELWVTDWSRIEGGDEAKVAFEAMAEFMKELKDKGFPGAGFDDYFALGEIDGFPVVTRKFEDGELEDESWLRSSKRRRLDPAEFEPPSGYKRRQMMPTGSN